MVLLLIVSIVSLLAIIGLAQTYGDVRAGIARIPPMTLWQARGPFEIARADHPIQYWAAIFARGIFWLFLLVFGSTILWSSLRP